MCIRDSLKVERARLNADPEVAAIKAQTEELEARAHQYIGAVLPTNIIAALEDLASDDPNPDWVKAVEELRRVLDSNDLAAPKDLRHDEIMEWTDSWLRGESAVTDSHIEEEVDIAALKEEIALAEKRYAKHLRAFAMIDDVSNEYLEAQAQGEQLSQLGKSLAEYNQSPSAAEVETLVSETITTIRPATNACLLYTSDAADE